MTAIHRITLLLCALLFLLPSVPAATLATPTRVAIEPYTGNNDLLPLTEFDNFCVAQQDGALDHAGGVCFPIAEEEGAVTLTIRDQHGGKVGATYSFQSPDGSYVAGTFCRSATLAIPAGATLLSVAINGPYRGPHTCIGGTGIGTAGEVQASFASLTSTNH